MEFLVYMEISAALPSDTADQTALRAAESVRARELADLGVLNRLWRVPGRRANWGIWVADDADHLHAVIESLPTFPYLSVTVHPLAVHPNAPKASN